MYFGHLTLHHCLLASTCLQENRKSSLYSLLLLRLDVDGCTVYRPEIYEQAAYSCRYWSVGREGCFYYHVALLGFIQGSVFIMTVILKASAFFYFFGRGGILFIRKGGHWSERMSFEVNRAKDATLLYMYLSLCSYSQVAVSHSWLRGLRCDLCSG